VCLPNEVILEPSVPTLIDVTNVYGTGGRICRAGFAFDMGGEYVFIQVIGGG